MADRIKGLTIQIGGDTTSLSKALSGTNKEIKNTQNQLKDVERLLKLDPGNTVLLQQKQKLLGQAVEETKNKLTALKDANDKVSGSAKNYEAWKKAYDPIQSEIDDTKKKLNELKNQQKEMENAGQVDTEGYKQLTQAVEETSQTLSNLKEQAKEVSKEFGNPISPEQYDALQREIFETEQQLGNLEKAAAQSNATLSKVSAVADKVADATGKMADKTKALSGVAGGLLGAAVGSAVKAGLSADDLNTLSKQSGFSTEQLQMWQYGADRVDVAVEDIVKSAQKLKKNMVSTSSDVSDAWKRLGISVTDSRGKLKNSTDVFNEAVMALSKVKNETERDTLAMTLFGKSADSLAGIIDDGGEAFQKFGQEAKDAGLILDQDALNKANEFNDAIDKLKAQSAGTFAEIGTEIAGMLIPFMDDLGESISAVLEFLRNLDEGQLKTLGTALLVIAGISPIFGLISKISSCISGVATSINGVITVLPKIQTAFSTTFEFIAANPIVLLVAAITALVVLIATKGDEIQALLQKLDDWLQNIFVKDWREVFGPFLGNILNGFFANVKNIWDSVKQILDGIIDFIRGVFTGDWERAWKGVQEIFGGIFDGLVALAKGPINAVISLINGMIDSVNSVIESINSISFKNPFTGKNVGFNIKQIENIPYLANGGTLWSGSAIVGEAGPELLTVNSGRAVVTPLTGDKAGNASGSGYGSYVDNRQYHFTVSSLSEFVKIQERMEFERQSLRMGYAKP